MNYKELLDWINETKESKYQEFSSSLASTSLKVEGVRLPILKAKCHELINDSSFDTRDIKLNQSVELNTIYFIVSIERFHSFDDKMSFVFNNVKYAKAWQITDIIPQYIKNKELSNFIPWFIKFASSKEEFARRFAFVYLIKYQKDQRVSELFNCINPSENNYFTLMGEAWFLATYAIWFPQCVYNFLSAKNIPSMLRKKTIQKIVDSYRIDSLTKNKFNELRNI